MKILGVIPARFASSRFPGKPLADIMGKTMIQRVYEQALKAASLTDVVIATDDDRIADEVTRFGGKFVLTSPFHASGTDRCAETGRTLSGFDVIVNIQGDEPFIDPDQIDLLAGCFQTPETQIATLVKKITIPDDLSNPNIPKVALAANGNALYFSRSTIPYLRNHTTDVWLQQHIFYKHIGIYGYKNEILQQITKLPVSLLEESEQLEQLRWLENGYAVFTKITHHETHAVDTPEDLEKIKLKFV